MKCRRPAIQLTYNEGSRSYSLEMFIRNVFYSYFVCRSVRIRSRCARGTRPRKLYVLCIVLYDSHQNYVFIILIREQSCGVV